VAEIERILPLSDGEREALAADHLFRVEITPYFISLIDPDDPDDPVRRQVIPSAAELVPFTGMMVDSLAEDAHSPVPGLVHRYPDRVLMLVTTQCQLEYLRATPQVRDVLLSGGDPLTLAPATLEYLLQSLRQIEHIEIIRIGTRVPVFMPMRVDDDLVEMLGRYHPLWMNIHVNHSSEITHELAQALDRLSRAGIPLGNQSVLLAGVNDCVEIQRQLVRDLVRLRVRPYYLYQCDLVAGAGHFRTPVGKGIEIMEGLRGHTSGYAVPTYVVDAPGGGGKIPLMPNYQLSYSDHQVVLRNYEGYISTYEEPQNYSKHDPLKCTFCRAAHADEVQDGIAGLFSGQRLAIKPQGFDDLHSRGGAEHRLRVSPPKAKTVERRSGLNGGAAGAIKQERKSPKNGKLPQKVKATRKVR
jgi:lysine 2,3-aminomutase